MDYMCDLCVYYGMDAASNTYPHDKSLIIYSKKTG